jgi:hypothetical protein
MGGCVLGQRWALGITHLQGGHLGKGSAGRVDMRLNGLGGLAG